MEDSKRRERRVKVKTPILFDRGIQQERGMAYNISYRGLFVACESALPNQGDKLRVVFPVPTKPKPTKIWLNGEVIWVMEGMGAKGGGFGLSILSARNDKDDACWRKYVGFLLQRSES